MYIYIHIYTYIYICTYTSRDILEDRGSRNISENTGLRDLLKCEKYISHDSKNIQGGEDPYISATSRI